MNYLAPANNTPEDDTDYLAALAFRYRSASTIRNKMSAAGVPATINTIRAKMTEFVEETGLVEARGDSWRIVTSPLPQLVEATPTAAANDVAAIPTNATPLLIHGDGLAMMRGLPDRSIDLVLCDLPYGCTGHKFDPVIDVQAWIDEMLRVVSDRGSIVAFASGKFTHAMMSAGLDFYKDRLVWEKAKATGQQLLRHMQAFEDIIVFSKGTINRNSKRTMTFNPQGIIEKVAKGRRHAMSHLNTKPRETWADSTYIQQANFPRTVLRYGKDANAVGLHPFAKPVALLEYLIRTYSNENAVVLDPTMGSGSTIVAAINTGRRAIGAENGTDKKGRCIFGIAKKRVAETISAMVVV